MSDYAHPESLVTTAWVAGQLDKTQVCLVEVIWGDSPAFGLVAYNHGHIPGAVVWDFENDLQSPSHDVVDKPGFETLMSNSGITPGTTIVLYSGLNNLLATFAFWLLKIYRHADVRLMDGDRQKWLAEDRPVATTNPVVVPTSYQAQEPDWNLRASRDDVLRSIGQVDHCLLDARSAEMFSGRDKAGAVRGGHIPGAINLCALREPNPDGSFKAWRVSSVQADGTFKPVEDLRNLFADLGLTPDQTIITYCVRGGLSTHAWFVLTQLLGYRQVREYDRSWAEWGNHEGAPIEQ